MFIFPLYAALVWYCCARWRREFLGFAAYVAGVACIVLLVYVDVRLMRLVFNTGASPTFLLLLWAEAGIIALIGGFVVLSPKERVARPCRGCGYELEGLDDPNPRCPECGIADAFSEPADGSCVSCGTRTATVSARAPRCERCLRAINAPSAISA